MRKMIFIVLFLIMAIGPAGVGEARTALTITDMAGRTVTVPQAPDRIVCLAPGTLRLMVYLSVQDKLVGVEDIEKNFPTTRPYWIANSGLSRLPSIGPGGPQAINKKPDMEKLLAVAPEVIFITYMEKAKADALQKDIGIPVVVLTYGPFASFDEKVFDSLRLAGRILDKEDRAEAVVDFIENARRDLASRAGDDPEGKKPTVFIGGLGYKGSHGIESTETSYAPFEWVRANNIACSEGKKGHLFIDKEKLLSWNPDIIFIDSGNNQHVRQDYEKKKEYYKGLKAFQEERVFGLHAFNWYVTNLGTVIADAYAVGKVLYPDRFADVDLAQKADEIYKFLVGQPVHEQMEKIYGPLGRPLPYLN